MLSYEPNEITFTCWGWGRVWKKENHHCRSLLLTFQQWDRKDSLHTIIWASLKFGLYKKKNINKTVPKLA
jgi:hypothetical protein